MNQVKTFRKERRGKMRLFKKKKKETMLGGTLTPARIMERYPGIEEKAQEALIGMKKKKFVQEIRNKINERIKKSNAKVSFSMSDKDIEDKILLIVENVIITTLIEKVVIEGNVTFEQELKKLHFTNENYQVLKDKTCDFIWDLLMETLMGQILFETPFFG